MKKFKWSKLIFLGYFFLLMTALAIAGDVIVKDGELIGEGDANFTGNITAEGEHTVLHWGVIQNFTCKLDQTATGAEWRSQTWGSAVCDGYDPMDYDYCFYSATRVDGSGSDRGLYLLYQDQGWIFASIADRVILWVRFLCWN